MLTISLITGISINVKTVDINIPNMRAIAIGRNKLLDESASGNKPNAVVVAPIESDVHGL
ncbi:hypothetical protein KHA80_08205 [Anaerobacillus sp. HL2]|nr:hypothetical protein KHA80_08205 [Anaerobacillus sp. HL2]